MSTTRKIGSGLAFSPQKDLAMFADQARRGRRLVGTAGLGHGWAFEDAEPEDVIFDLAHESSPSPEYLDIFEAAGWSHVLSVGDIHIFKAAPGTPPVHTGTESRREELARNRDRMGRAALIAVAIWAVVAATLWLTGLPPGVDGLIVGVLAIPVVYTVLPWWGYSTRLRRSGADG